jgi:RNA polymerase sigma-70 factor (ECF subfamily)
MSGEQPAVVAPGGPEPTDLDLVSRIKSGEEDAFEQMVDRYHARVYSLSYGVLRNAEDAEESTQDSFLTLYRKIGTFDESKKFFSWFYRVALNQAYSRARRRKPATTTLVEDYLPRFSPDGHIASPEFPDWSVSIEDGAIARDLAARAGEFISELPPTYRDVIWMYDVEDMSTADIAETLEISIPALKSRLHRARLYVRQRLTEISRAPAPAPEVAPR